MSNIFNDYLPLISKKPEPVFKARSSHRILYICIALVALMLVVYGSYRVLRLEPAGGGRAAGDDTQAILSAVGKLVELPAGETPTIATVTDLNALKDQAFFQDAQLGDKVLIFSQSKKAILYRPSGQRIVAVGPLINK